MSSTLLWYASRATGIVALVLLTGTVVLGVLTASRFSTRRWPGFATQDLHRRVSLTALVFLAGHILSAVVDTYVHIGWTAVVVPFTSSYRALGVGLGAVAVDLLLAVSVSSLVRHRLRARTWRALHWLAYMAWPVAVLHGFAMGTDMRLRWVLALTLGCIGAAAGAATWRLRRRWEVRRQAAVHAPEVTRRAGVPDKHLAHR
ncbi:MAG TPA: ferric reductase-like transmembrane domain-containing protein [Acidimicrobiales bacterium]|nr:ferric reductase-like transmembrane domain-containing protein [Acidimicrobiales bacterium]